MAPDAWAKLVAWRDAGETEIGAFGIAAAGDPLLVTDVRLVAQVCGPAEVAFDDDAVADLFDRLVDEGRRPEEFGRIWIHSHPGNSAAPSSVDEETFARVFGRCDWAAMAILARGGACSARLRVASVAPVEIELPVAVDFAVPFVASDPGAWRAEYEACVRTAAQFTEDELHARLAGLDDDPWARWDDWTWSPVVGEGRHAEFYD